jgi:hypothetical protein
MSGTIVATKELKHVLERERPGQLKSQMKTDTCSLSSLRNFNPNLISGLKKIEKLIVFERFITFESGQISKIEKRYALDKEQIYQKKV